MTHPDLRTGGPKHPGLGNDPYVKKPTNPIRLNPSIPYNEPRIQKVACLTYDPYRCRCYDPRSNRGEP